VRELSQPWILLDTRSGRTQSRFFGVGVSFTKPGHRSGQLLHLSVDFPHVFLQLANPVLQTRVDSVPAALEAQMLVKGVASRLRHAPNPLSLTHLDEAPVRLLGQPQCD